MSAVTISRRALVSGALSAACWPPVRASSAKLTLRVNATPSIFKPTFQVLAQEFERRHSHIKVELRTTARDQEDQIQLTLRQALIDELPDVSLEGLKYLRALQRRRIPVPLGQFMHGDTEWNNGSYGKSLTDSTAIDGEVLAIGVAVSLPLIYYDPDRITAALGSSSFPQQWPELRRLIVTLGRKARHSELGGFAQHADSSWVYMSVLNSLGGHVMGADERRLTLDDAAGLAALEVFETFGNAGQARFDMGREQARQAFAGGAISLLIDSSSSLRMLQRQIGGRFPLATARLPVTQHGTLPASGIAAIVCAQQPDRQTAAWQFVKFVCGPTGQSIIGTSTGYLPANDVVVQSPELLGNYYESHPLIQPAVASLARAVPWYAFPGRNAMKIDSVLIDGVTSVVTLSRSPVQAAAAMTRTIEKLLPKNQLRNNLS